MAITAIRLQNFMAFGEDTDAEWIELKPITLLFGRNSSGKSAIIRALRLLKQSLTDAPADSPFAYKTEDGVDVGFFNTMLHQKARDEREKEEQEKAGQEKLILRFEFRMTVSPSSLMRLLSLEKIEEKDAQVEIAFGFGWNERQGHAELVLLVIDAPSTLVGEKRRTIFCADRLEYEKARQDPNAWWFCSDFLPLPGKTYREADQWPAVLIDLQSGFLPMLDLTPEARRQAGSWGDEVTSVRGIVNDFRTELAELLNHIEYTRPMRPEPKRFYMLDDAQQRHWERQGLRAFLKLIKKELNEAQLKELGIWLEKLELGIYIDPNVLFDISERGVVSELYLDEGSKGVRRVSYADIGFGASQVVPVVIQSLLAEENSLVIIEQPELHLHPSAQAVLADLFIKKSNDGVRFLIETHSEHLILRLQRRIRKQVIPPSDLFVIYVTRRGGESRCHSLQLDEEGDFIDDWPEGFFEDGFKEMFDLEVLHESSTIEKDEKPSE